jgi:predicted nucleic acid-binding protein
MLGFRAGWYVKTQRNSILGMDKTTWTVPHKLRRAMVRPERERLFGLVEVDEAYWDGEDMMVAAIAEANDCVVVTDNETHFAGVRIVTPLRLSTR